VSEISIILKNNLLITVEEFKFLDRYSTHGQVWTLIYMPTPHNPCKVTCKTTEYIFDPEALTIFYIVSRNILASWETECTKYLVPGDEFSLSESLLIRPYSKL